MSPRAEAAPAAPVALFLPNLGGGGAERAVINLATQLAEKGHAVDLVLGSASGELLGEVSEPVRIVDLGASRLALAWWPLLRYLRSSKPRALMSTLEHANVMSLFLAPFAPGTQVVIREANTASLDVDPGSRLSAVTRAAMRALYPRAHTVVAVSEGVAAELGSRLGVKQGRVRVIANPVLTPRLFELGRERPDHPWFGDGGPPVVLAVGRLAPQKGFDVLLEAFRQVVAARPARLVVLGEGPMRGELEGLARELGVAACVDLPGFQLNPFSYMAHADAFVLSSRWEGLPNVLIQAVALGAPAVATDCRSGPSEILEGGRFGHLVPVEDPAALAGALLAVLAGEKRPAPPEWAERYRADVVVRQYAEALGIE